MTFKRTYRSTRQQREAAERAKRIRERSGPESMEWIQSALFLYVAHKEHLGKALCEAVWAYTAAMIDKLERILTEAEYITGAKDIAEEYRWAAKQLRVAIARHLKLLQMLEGRKDIMAPEVSGAGKHIAEKVHHPEDEDVFAAIRYIWTEFKSSHQGCRAIPKSTYMSF